VNPVINLPVSQNMEVLERLYNWQFLKKGSAPCSQLFTLVIPKC
jgi:hypothetical protein